MELLLLILVLSYIGIVLGSDVKEKWLWLIFGIWFAPISIVFLVSEVRRESQSKQKRKQELEKSWNTTNK